MEDHRAGAVRPSCLRERVGAKAVLVCSCHSRDGFEREGLSVGVRVRGTVRGVRPCGRFLPVLFAGPMKSRPRRRKSPLGIEATWLNCFSQWPRPWRRPRVRQNRDASRQWSRPEAGSTRGIEAFTTLRRGRGSDGMGRGENTWQELHTLFHRIELEGVIVTPERLIAPPVACRLVRGVQD